jgi:hypothetical protein
MRALSRLHSRQAKKIEKKTSFLVATFKKSVFLQPI